MKYKHHRVVLAALLLSSILYPASSLFAQAPSLINYQGRLLDGTNLVNGNVGLSLRLVDADVGGAVLYEDSNTVAVADGLYATFIGDDTTFGSLASALDTSNLWIEVAVNGVALSPRERLASAAYAVHARQALVFTGAVLDTQLSANIARLDGSNQTFSGPVHFSSGSNTFTGTFSGDAGSLTNVQLAHLIADVSPVIAWGANDFGQANVPAHETSVVAIAAGVNHSMALRADGTVSVWGQGASGSMSAPATATGVVAMAGGLAYSMALRSDGTVIAWGGGFDDETNVPATATGVVAIAAGYYHGLAARADGTVVAWGRNISGQANVPATATGVVAVAGGLGQSLALRSDGTVIYWGGNASMNIVPVTATGVVAIAAGNFHNLALRSDGTVIAWGDNTRGQTNVPVTATGVVAIAGGGYQSLALRSDGTVIAWGDNFDGQTNVPAVAQGALAIASGSYHHMALSGGRQEGAQVALLDRKNTFAGSVSATAFAGDGSDLTNIGNASLATEVRTNIAARLASNVWATANAARIAADAALSNKVASLDTNVAVRLASNAWAAANSDLVEADAALSNRVASLDTNVAARLASNVWAAANSTTNHVRRTGDTMSGSLYITSSVPFPHLRVAAAASAPYGAFLSIDATATTNGNNYHLFATGNSAGEGAGKLILQNFTDNQNLMVFGTNGNVGIGTLNPTNKLHVAGTVQATAYITTSDRNAKENIAPVSSDEILAKVAALPISTWTFRDEPNGTHLGPMAQDFHAAFGLGNTDTGIMTVDADGVALAAIQALAKENEGLKEQVSVFRNQVSELEAENRALREDMDVIKARLGM